MQAPILIRISTKALVPPTRNIPGHNNGPHSHSMPSARKSVPLQLSIFLTLIYHPVEANDFHLGSESGSKGSVDACLKNNAIV
jgi:hypothetical protein